MNVKVVIKAVGHILSDKQESRKPYIVLVRSVGYKKSEPHLCCTVIVS